MGSFEDNYRKWHTRLSHAKSTVRIAACGFSIWQIGDTQLAIMLLAGGLLLAEILGILEEMI